jgi:predicted Zn-dependent protease
VRGWVFVSLAAMIIVSLGLFLWMRPRLPPFSDSDEIALGQKLATAYDTQFQSQLVVSHDKDSDARTNAYIQAVGMKVAGHATRTLPWRFHLISEDFGSNNPVASHLFDDGFYDALALPGGQIFLGKGLLREMDSEDALAAILGQQIALVDSYASAARTLEAAKDEAIQTSDLDSRVAQIPYTAFLKPYSRRDQLLADSNGVQMAVAAGYSPQGALDFLSGIQRQQLADDDGAHRSLGSSLRTLLNWGGATQTNYFKHHLAASERLEQLQKLSLTRHWPHPPLTPLFDHQPLSPTSP